MCLKFKSEIKQKLSDFTSREMLNPLWIFKQNISSLISQNKCTMQTLGNLCCLGLGFPSHRVSLRQTVASPWVAEVTAREMKSTGRTQPPATAYFCAMPVPVLVCLWACPQRNSSTCKFLSTHSWFQVAAGASECQWQPCQKIWVEFEDSFSVIPLLICTALTI